MAIFSGNTGLSGVFSGSSEIDKVYYGNSLIYQKTTPMPTGCIAEYLFNDNLNDSSGNGYNMTNYGITFADSGLSGIGRCAYLYRVYALIPLAVIPSNHAVSIAFWAKTSKTSQEWVLDSYGSSYVGLRVAMTNNMLFQIHGGGEVSSTISPCDGTWHFICFTWNGEAGGTLSLYIDGVLNNTSTSTNILQHSQSSIYFGRSEGSSTSNRFEGYFGKMRTYDHVLTLNEIRVLYNNGLGI